MAGNTALKEKKASIISRFGDAKDTGSTEAQVALLTDRIKGLNPHLQTNKKDHSARGGLMKMVGQRRRLLTFLQSKDEKRYADLIQKLDLRK